MKKVIPLWGWEKYIGIQYGGCHQRSITQIQQLRMLGEIVQFLSPLLVKQFIVPHQVLEQNPSVGSHFFVGDRTPLKEFHDVRS